MIDFVIDANILMSILISGKASYRPLLTYYNFILPDFVLVEIEKYKDVLSQESLEKSEKLLDKIDLKDVSYVSIAIQLDLPLLTRDKYLYEGLQKQKFRKVILFEDFLRTL